MNGAEDLLIKYQIVVAEIRTALRKAGYSERDVILQTINLPEFKDMLPEDVLNFYKDVKLKTILWMHNTMKLSVREIARRLGGDSYFAVNQILKENQ